MKKLATLAASAALLAIAIVPALAAGSSCSNGTTGPFSANNCTINNSSNVTVNNVNDAVITNNVSVRSNTGGNHADLNTLGGTVNTGNSTLNTTVTNVANINTNNITGGPAMGSNWGTNNVTGPFSANDTVIQNSQRLGINNQNTLFVANNVAAESNSGDNTASTNTGPGNIRTGDALLGLVVATHGNDNLNNIIAGAGGSGLNQAGNGTTGPFSANNATINNSSDIFVGNFNDAVIRNNVNVLANSGRNHANTNTLGGSVTTGGAGAGVGVNNEANINTIQIAASMGGFGGAAMNGVTGPYSANNSWVGNNQNVDVENWNNKCRSHNADTLGHLTEIFSADAELWRPRCQPWNLGVTNNVDALAQTGDNSASTGTGPGSITDGWAQLVQAVKTHLNDSFTQVIGQ